MQRQAQDFDREQRNVDQRLLQVTNFHASDNAVQLLSSHLDKLEKLDIADAYVRQLQDVEHMRSVRYRSIIGTSTDQRQVPC